MKMFPETNLFIFAHHNCGQQLWTNRFWHTLFQTNPDAAFQGPPWQWVGHTHTHTRAHATHHGGWGPFGGHSFLTVALSCLNANPMRKYGPVIISSSKLVYLIATTLNLSGSGQQGAPSGIITNFSVHVVNSAIYMTIKLHKVILYSEYKYTKSILLNTLKNIVY